jgi:Protein of unknown function (DUF3467)
VTEPADSSRPTNFQIQLPPELEAGAYANFLGVWHTAHEFTLEFAQIQPAQLADPDDPESPVRLPARVVASVKIPVTVAFDVIRALNENLGRYEQAFGEIRRPGEPPSPL